MCIGPLAKDDSPEPDSHSLVWAAPTLDAPIAGHAPSGSGA